MDNQIGERKDLLKRADVKAVIASVVEEIISFYADTEREFFADKHEGLNDDDILQRATLGECKFASQKAAYNMHHKHPGFFDKMFIVGTKFDSRVEPDPETSFFDPRLTEHYRLVLVKGNMAFSVSPAWFKKEDGFDRSRHIVSAEEEDLGKSLARLMEEIALIDGGIWPDADAISGLLNEGYTAFEAKQIEREGLERFLQETEGTTDQLVGGFRRDILEKPELYQEQFSIYNILHTPDGEIRSYLDEDSPMNFEYRSLVFQRKLMYVARGGSL